MPGQETFVALRRRALLDEQRPRLLGLAYRLLGSVTEARLLLDDVAQSSSSADLTSVVTHAALRRLQVRPRRERYAGRRLPEPVSHGPLSLPMLIALEGLSPLERCAYVLRVVDGLSYAEAASALGRSGPATRQLVRRARNHLSRNPVPSPPDPGVVRRFAGACRSGRLAPLLETLSAGVVVVTDLPSSRPRGRDEGAATVLATLRRLPRGTVLVEEPVNGELGLVGRVGGRPVFVLAVQSDAGRITRVLLLTNPARLAGMVVSASDVSPGRRVP